MTARLSPEQQILVATTLGMGGQDSPAQRPIVWPRLLELAAWHRLLPLLWHHLHAVEPSLEPPEQIAAALKHAMRKSTARNLNLGIELDRALEVLEAEGVPVVLLKGAALLETVYPHVGLRPMVDLDLLVPRSDIERAHDALLSLGYAVSGARVHRDDEAWLAARHHHLPLVKADGAVMIELHHQLFADRLTFDVGSVWDRAVPGARPPVHLLPSPEDLLLHVAAHFALDRMNRGESGLGQLADIVRIPQRWDIDWATLIERSRGASLADRLFLALNSAALLGRDAAPPEVVAELAPASYTPRRGEQFLRHRVLNSGTTFPLEQLAGGRRRLFPGYEALELYVRDGDVVVPSRARLHARRWVSLAHRVVRDVPHPIELARDIRLSRWILSLRS